LTPDARWHTAAEAVSVFEAHSTVGCDRQQLLDLIDRAFDGVVLGDGVSLHETIVLDNYGDESERQAARAPDEKTDWRRLVHDPEMHRVGGVGGLAFYDAEGLRFHLPVYLIRAIDALDRLTRGTFVESELLFTLTDCTAHTLAKLSILNHAQRTAIRGFLIYWRDKMEPSRQWQPARMSELDSAIDEIWNPQSSLLDTPDRWPPDP
jgi:hypothetical protein